jgi:hypothetical protein
VDEIKANYEKDVTDEFFEADYRSWGCGAD